MDFNFSEQQKMLQLSTDESSQASPEEKIKIMGEALENITRLTIDTLVASISTIKTEHEQVSDKGYIREFLTKTDKKVFDSIRDHLAKIKEEAEIRPLRFTCSSCQHEFDTPFTLDQANFFA